MRFPPKIGGGNWSARYFTYFLSILDFRMSDRAIGLYILLQTFLAQ